MEQTLIGIHVRRKQRGKVRHARLLPADKMAEGGCRLPRLVAEQVTPAGRLDHALMNMHRTAGRVRQRLGHAHHVQAMFEGDFLEQVFEQKSLIGQQQRIAVQQVDLKLTDTHLMHKGVTGQAKCRHALVHLIEKRPQAVVGADAERRKTVFATPIQAHGRAERLSRIGVGCKHKELQLGRYHRCEPPSRVAGDHRL